MMRPLPFIIVLCLWLVGMGRALAFELSEQLLGIPDPPFKVGQLLTAEELSSHKCQKTENGLVVCALGKVSTRAFGIMLDASKNPNRVTGVLSFWKCEVGKCSEAVRDTVAKLTKQLGAAPESLDGTPIWKDRRKNHRDLMVQQFGPDMVSIVLIESYP